ncbi:hypothetical protein, partial [Clostridium sp. HBUAS56017]|uniref:hypothetical protein n=1 Tax=Clostridium sp. HBUAS56017 TaxID=2571128 RepID=UPI001177764D
MDAKDEIINESRKYDGYIRKVDTTINYLNKMNSSVGNNFQGKSKNEIVNRIRNLIKDCKKLSDGLDGMKKSLNNLSKDIAMEEKKKK